MPNPIQPQQNYRWVSFGQVERTDKSELATHYSLIDTHDYHQIVSVRIGQNGAPKPIVTAEGYFGARFTPQDWRTAIESGHGLPEEHREVLKNIRLSGKHNHHGKTRLSSEPEEGIEDVIEV